MNQEIISYPSWSQRICSKPSTMIERHHYCFRIQYDMIHMQLPKYIFYKIFPPYYPVDWIVSFYLNRMKQNWIKNRIVEGIVCIPLPSDILNYIMTYL